MIITKSNGIQKGTFMLIISDIDKQAELDIRTGKGMIITEPIKDKKSNDNTYNKGGIRSEFFYREMHDDNAFKERYSCECGELQGKSHESSICPYCRTPVKLVDIDLSKFGYIVLKDYRIIHPALYEILDNIFGTKNKVSVLENILRTPKHKDTDEDGNIIESQAYDMTNFKDQPFAMIGMMEFQRRFDEIFEYYVSKNKRNKIEGNAELIRLNKDKLFIKHIPVFTSALRFSVIQDEINFVHGADKIYNLLQSTVSTLNKTNGMGMKMSIDRKLAYTQKQMRNLYQKVFSLINTKFGFIKFQLIAGRMNMTARNVITPGPELAADEIIMPYMTFLELYKFEIIHVLKETQNITETQAYDEWNEATLCFSNKVYNIMKNMIAKNETWVLINRPPTIDLGSTLLVNIVDITKEIDDLTMSISSMVLSGLNADFDGDNLTIMKLSSRDQIYDLRRFNPRRYFMISHDHGLLNEGMLPIKDSAIGITMFNII